MIGTLEQERNSIESVSRHLPDSPIATTRGRGWAGVTVDLHARSSQYVVTAPARDHHLICYCTTGRGRLVQRRDGIVHASVISAGMSILAPAGYASVWEGEAAPSARVRVPTELVQRAADEIGPRARASLEIVNVFRTSDPEIESFAKLLLGEIERAAHPAQALMVEAVSCALAAHLLRTYNGFEPPGADPRPALCRRHLDGIASYIEDHLDEPISLAALAAIAGVSRFHFTRLFKRSTGLSPMAYVERCRIRRAQELLKRGNLPLSEIALAAGFADQSHFTRRFHRHVGSTPAVFAKECGMGGGPRRAR